ncbi:MAG TPA: MerR family transcriptional regulator [Terracidiphilus sp.]|nr:MerR family transcriptional regulator [Terracidiphilus sp.]
MQNAGYTIRSMAERCGMTAHTLRYYERVGLIQPVGRAHNGHRRYSDADEAWIHFLHCMRATSMPIREMQRYAELRELGDATSEQRRKILEDHQAAIAEQIVELQRAHALLTHKIANYKAIEQRIRIDRPALNEPEVDCALEPVG